MRGKWHACYRAGRGECNFRPETGDRCRCIKCTDFNRVSGREITVTLAHLNIQFGFPRVAFYFILFYFIFERRERRPRLDSDRFELQNVFAFGIERDNR